jgi:hypothetical protein
VHVAIKSVSIRIEEAMLDKLNYVAKYEGRSLNSHVLVLIRDSIQDHAALFAEGSGCMLPDDYVKLPRKT